MQSNLDSATFLPMYTFHNSAAEKLDYPKPPPILHHPLSTSCKLLDKGLIMQSVIFATWIPAINLIQDA